MINDAKQLKRFNRMFTSNETSTVEPNMLNISCPFCGHFNIHTKNATRGDDMNYGTTTIEFHGECGHKWDLIFGDHKGDVFAKIVLTGIDMHSFLETIEAIDEIL